MSAAPISMPMLATLDWVLLAVLVGSVLLGLKRGFVTEAMALVGWLVAWLAARWWAADVLPWLPAAIAQAWRPLAAAVLVFVGVLIGWAVLTRLLSALVGATPLALADRLLGAGFGALRAGVVLLVATGAVWWSGAACQPWWQTSHGAAWGTGALRAVQDWLPSQGFDFSFMRPSSCAASSV